MVRPVPATVLALSWLVAFNLRSGFIGLGPALPDLTLDLGLSFSQASFLVAVPTLMMGLAAIPGGSLADRWGPVRVIVLGLSLVAVGGGLRAIAPGFAALLLFTFLFGAGIGLSQPSLPRLMRSRFPHRLGVSTGIYASGLITGSIVAASITGPFLDRMEDPAAWRTPMALWGVLAAIALAAWLAVMRPWHGTEPAAETGTETPGYMTAAAEWSPWRDRRAWIAALLFAAQGLVYYLLVAWLPAIYGEAGLDATATAALFAVFNAATLPAILLFPGWSDRLHRRRPPIFVAAVMFLIGVLGLLLLPLADPWRWLWAALAGAAVSGLFAMSLVLPADIAPSGRAGAAAGMVLGIGYAVSALGPIVAGVVHDVTGSFEATLLLLPVFGIAMIVLSAIVPELPRSTSPLALRTGERGAGG
ncbi:MAG: MFS transporter [Chloroflexota bacterium]|nr:MFS transporter [Chloroflexota bacterium]